MMIKYIKIGVAGITILILSILITSTTILYNNNKQLKKDLSVSVSNEKAFIAENSMLKDENRAFQFTVEQLEYFNDSLTIKMNEVRKELKIKDKDLKQMQYLLSKAQKKDTIIFTETIFKDTSLNIDTTINDKWYQLDVGLTYPNKITIEPTFISEKYIIVNYRKETINPPHKCAFVRAFQRKHKVVEVNIVEKNPYIENGKQRFIEIIK